MKTRATRLLLVSRAVAPMLLLAGCSATHVGESWQCPLAQGASCTSIAEADPAVPASAAGSAVLFGEPLHGARGQVAGAAAGDTCTGACGFLAWLGKLTGFAVSPAARPAPDASVTFAATEPDSGQHGEVPSGTPAPGAAIADNTSLRVPEVLGRIWIAPFVDADGIYREAHWVRVVLEHAGWKLP